MVKTSDNLADQSTGKVSTSISRLGTSNSDQINRIFLLAFTGQFLDSLIDESTTDSAIDACKSCKCKYTLT